MSVIKKIAVYIFAFFLLYYTNVFPNINPYIFPIVFLVLFIILEIPNKEKILSKQLKNKTIFKFSAGIILSALYYGLIYILNNNNVSLEGSRIVQSTMFLVYLCLVIYLMGFVGGFNKTPDEKMGFLFRLASIQGVICIAMFVFPGLKNIADNLFLYNSDFAEGDYILGSRIFGISNSYTYGMPIFHGLLTGICFYYGIIKNRKYFKYLPFIFVVSLLNGRTGVLIAIASVILTALYMIFRSKNKARVITATIAAIVLLLASLNVLKKIAPNVHGFIMNAYDEVSSYIKSGELSGTTQYLLEDRLFFPEGSALLFGSGIRVYEPNDVFKQSDIGYVNDLFMGGIIYAILLYGAYLAWIMKSFDEKNVRFLKVVLIVALLVANWKGEIFKNATFVIGLMYILMVGLEYGKKQGIDKNEK